MSDITLPVETDLYDSAEHALPMELFTDFYRITGSLFTAVNRTNGVLNDSEPQLVLHKVITNNLIRNIDSGIESRYARIDKNSIKLAVPNEEAENERLAGRPRASGFSLLRRVLIGMGNFEISGNLHLEQEIEIKSLLLHRTDSFIGVTDASIIYLPNPSRKFTTSTVLINKNHVEFVCSGAY
jgi:hypothetical protein